MSGEYFLSDKAKDDLKNKKKREEKLARKQEKMEAKAREFEAPEEDLPTVEKKKKKKTSDESVGKTDSLTQKRPNVEDLKAKFLKKRQKV